MLFYIHTCKHYFTQLLYIYLLILYLHFYSDCCLIYSFTFICILTLLHIPLHMYILCIFHVYLNNEFMQLLFYTDYKVKVALLLYNYFVYFDDITSIHVLT